MNWIVAGVFGLMLYVWGRRHQGDHSYTEGVPTPEKGPKEGGISVYCDHETGEIVIEVTEDDDGGGEVVVFTLADPETGYSIARAISMAAMRIEAKRDGKTDSQG